MAVSSVRPRARKTAVSSSADTDNTEVLRLFRTLVLIRRAEEKIREEYFKDEMKTPVHLGIGEEAIPVGVCAVAPPTTKMFGTYRNHALYLAVTQDTDGLFAELYGKATGPGKGKAGSMHLAAPACGLIATSAVVATTIPVAVGAALANRYRSSNDLVVSFFGDGAVEEGVFWESLNFACLKALRVLLVCEDNGLAIHTPGGQRQGFRSLPEALRGFRCHVASGDGSDLPTVMALTRQLLEQMQREPKPGVLHLSYFRFLEHVGPREDFESGYRRKPSREELARLDPVRRFEQVLRQRGCSDETIASVEESVQAQIARSIEAARRAPFADASELHRDLFA